MKSALQFDFNNIFKAMHQNIITDIKLNLPHSFAKKKNTELVYVFEVRNFEMKRRSLSLSVIQIYDVNDVFKTNTNENGEEPICYTKT